MFEFVKKMFKDPYDFPPNTPLTEEDIPAIIKYQTEDVPWDAEVTMEIAERRFRHYLVHKLGVRSMDKMTAYVKEFRRRSEPAIAKAQEKKRLVEETIL